MKYIILLSIGMSIFLDWSDRIYNSQELNTELQKSQKMEVFRVKDSLYADDAYLIWAVDTIKMQQGIDTLSLYLKAPNSSGFMWAVDTIRSNLQVKQSEYIALAGKNNHKNFQKFTFAHSGCWNSKQLKVHLKRPFDPDLPPIDSCIVQFQQLCEQ